MIYVNIYIYIDYDYRSLNKFWGSLSMLDVFCQNSSTFFRGLYSKSRPRALYGGAKNDLSSWVGVARIMCLMVGAKGVETLGERYVCIYIYIFTTG